jgi:hypothetical protein
MYLAESLALDLIYIALKYQLQKEFENIINMKPKN